MKKTAINLAIVFGISLGASFACAEPGGQGDSRRQEGPQRGQMEDKVFKEMDTNGDDVISRAEYDALHAKRFKEMDADKNGKITREEISAARKILMDKARNSRFDEADSNHDGALTREEAEKMPMLSKNFEKVDANHDGKVSREELDDEMEKVRRERDSKK